MDSHSLQMQNGRGFGTTDKVHKDSLIAETRAERVRLARDVLGDLEAEIERLEHDYRDALEQLADVRWKLAKAERENAKLREAFDSPIDPADYEKAQEEIAVLRREVELYRHDRSLDHEREHAHPWWQISRR